MAGFGLFIRKENIINTTVTYLPVIYNKHKDKSSDLDVLSPNAPLQHFNQHVEKMSGNGWALVSVEALPRIKYSENIAFNEVVGYLLFWQRHTSIEETEACVPLEVLQDKSKQASHPISKPEPMQEANSKLATTVSELKSQEQKGIDLNQKYQISKINKNNVNTVNKSATVTRSPNPGPVNSGSDIVSTVLPVAASASIDDTVVSDFSPDDPLVEEIRSLRHAVALQGYIVDPGANDNVQLDDPE